MIRQTIIVVLTFGALGAAMLCVLSCFDTPSGGSYDAKLGVLTLIELENGWIRLRRDGAVVKVFHRDSFFERITWRSGGKEYFAKVGWVSYMTEGVSMCRYRNTSLPFWPVAVVLGVFPGITFVSALRRRRARTKPNHCSNCGYNLTGNTSGVCPECSRKIERDNG